MTERSDTPIVLVDTTDVRVAEFSLPPGEEGECHRHSAVTEYCYCLEGSLAVVLRGGQRKILAPGEKLEIRAGIVHQVINVDAASCRYLVVQGVGAFDFVRGATRVDCIE
ncbi:MAG TPA: cupin domain-containing protein [Gammaproteobacteria bacterium]|nr:cupin domain-containing protein [Gammaproteobacteria bacterium]